METAKNGDGAAPSVSANGVQITIQQLREELLQLLQQRAQVMQRIGAAKRTIAGLAALFGESTLDQNLIELLGRGTARRQPGLTRMCRTILMEADRAMSVHDIRAEISARNPLLLADHKDPVASLTTILNRLVNYGEAERVSANDNRRAWQWTC